jgi:hypothetical protein
LTSLDRTELEKEKKKKEEKIENIAQNSMCPAVGLTSNCPDAWADDANLSDTKLTLVTE